MSLRCWATMFAGAIGKPPGRGGPVAKHGFAGDGKQRPLVPRSRCLPRLKPSVRLPHNPWAPQRRVDTMTKISRIDAETQRAIGIWDAEVRQTVHVRG
jgi:hypothetical protein